MENSKIVTLRRFPSFVELANGDTGSYHDDANTYIGSYFTGKKPGSGLEFWEIDLLLPRIINIPITDRDFRKQVELFYCDITTKVEAGKGTPLQIGLEKDNNAILAIDNMPIDIDAYIKFRHAKGHPHVSLSEADGKGNKLKKWFIVDSEQTSETLQLEIGEKDKALASYLSINTSKEKIRQVLTNILQKNIDKISDIDRLTTLRKLAEDSPKKFLDTVNDRNLDTKYKILRAIQLGILNRVGERIINKAGDQIGGNLEEAVLFWNDPSESETVGLIIAACREKIKQEVL
jgi:hypothetical protein